MQVSASGRALGLRRPILLLLFLLLAAATAAFALAGSADRPGTAQAAGSDTARDVVFAIHGGAGGITRESVPPPLEQEYRTALRQALEAGYAVIQRGGESTDAVKAAIVTMEDNPLFNAGKGAVFTTDGKHELDASIMDGKTLDTGSVTGVEHIKNPIELADRVRTDSRHMFFAGYGAELFAMNRGFKLVTQDYFFTDRRWQSLMAAKAGGGGTWGGGLTKKPAGRIGDSPVIGAGTYADNDTVAVSATGTGEFFIRLAVAHDISALIDYARMSVRNAAQTAIDKVGGLGGDGGVIALGRRGDLAMPFNTPGMFSGWVTKDGRFVVKIFGDE